ncbi:MAG TPA: hypothetical protein VK933_10925, partial [Longimicrobiales bacterium]|nr:hypothetical protein [Longimicrobiales bacterium]
FRGERVRAIHIDITDRDAYQPVWMTLVLMSEIRRLHPNQFRITNDGMTQMLGSQWARDAIDSGSDPRTIWSRWQSELEQWAPIRGRYEIYR